MPNSFVVQNLAELQNRLQVTLEQAEESLQSAKNLAAVFEEQQHSILVHMEQLSGLQTHLQTLQREAEEAPYNQARN